MYLNDLTNLFNDLESELDALEEQELELIKKAENYYGPDPELLDAIHLAYDVAVSEIKERYLHELIEAVPKD